MLDFCWVKKNNNTCFPLKNFTIEKSINSPCNYKLSVFFYWQNFTKKRNKKQKKLKMNWFWRFLIAKSEGEKIRRIIRYFYIWCEVCSEKYGKEKLKIFT
jgi:hypothetical protein